MSANHVERRLGFSDWLGLGYFPVLCRNRVNPPKPHGMGSPGEAEVLLPEEAESRCWTSKTTDVQYILCMKKSCLQGFIHRPNKRVNIFPYSPRLYKLNVKLNDALFPKDEKATVVLWFFGEDLCFYKIFYFKSKYSSSFLLLSFSLFILFLGYLSCSWLFHPTYHVSTAYWKILKCHLSMVPCPIFISFSLFPYPIRNNS